MLQNWMSQNISNFETDFMIDKNILEFLLLACFCSCTSSAVSIEENPSHPHAASLPPFPTCLPLRILTNKRKFGSRSLLTK